MCKTFIPILSPKGRIVNLSSVSSTLKPYSEQIKQRFRNPNMTLQDLEQLSQEYQVRILPIYMSSTSLLNPSSALHTQHLRILNRLRRPRKILLLLQSLRQRPNPNPRPRQPRHNNQRLLSRLGEDGHGRADWPRAENAGRWREDTLPAGVWRDRRSDGEVLGECECEE